MNRSTAKSAGGVMATMAAVFSVIIGALVLLKDARGAELRLAIQAGADSQAPAAGVLTLGSHEAQISGIQVDIRYDPDAAILECETVSALAEQQKELLTSSPERGVRRILIIGSNARSISDGVLALLRIRAVEGAGDIPLVVQMENARATSPEGESVGIAAVQQNSPAAVITAPGEPSRARPSRKGRSQRRNTTSTQ